MVQKRHQEEISGPSDSTVAAATATELRASKRTRFQSSKAAENEFQKSLKDVPFQPPTPSKLTPIPTPTPTSQRISTSFKDPSQLANYSAATSQNKAQAFPKKEEWLQQFEGAKNKAEKRKILTNHLGYPQPFPQKLGIGPSPSVPEEAFPNADYFDPHTLFCRFFPAEIFQEIADNTNEYAHQEIARKKSETPSGNRWTKLGRKRGTPIKWEDVTAKDIEAFFGAILLIGAQLGNRDIDYYFSCSKADPAWPVAEYISQHRFKQISSYLKINKSGDLPDERWFEKVNPMANSFRKATTLNLYRLPQDLCVDEILVQFSGRSKHTIQMNSKAAGEGYKIYCLCYPNGYLIDFRFTSAEQKIAEIGDWEGFTASEVVVLDLITQLQTRLPRSTSSPYILHTDNFFTRISLFSKLYEFGIGANETAKAGSGILRSWSFYENFYRRRNTTRSGSIVSLKTSIA